MGGNICDCTSYENLTVYNNGGSNTFTQIATLKFFLMEVHLNLDSMANILAMKYFASIPGLHISIDSSKDCAIIVEYHNNMIKFQEYCDGLYYYDTVNKFISQISSYSFLSIVKENKEYFNNPEIQ